MGALGVKQVREKVNECNENHDSQISLATYSYLSPNAVNFDEAVHNLPFPAIIVTYFYFSAIQPGIVGEILGQLRVN